MVMLKRTLISCVALSMSLVGCATMPSPILIRSGSEPALMPIAAGWKSAFLVPPKLNFVSVTTEKPLQVDTSTYNTISRILEDFASDALIGRGLRAYHQGSLTAEQSDRLVRVVPAFQNQTESAFKKTMVSDALRDRLNDVKDVLGTDLIIMQIVNTKVGSGGTWNANTGAITAGTSTSEFHACMVNVKTGDIVWRSEVFVRSFPGGRTLNESAQLLFSTFPTKK